MKTEKALFAAGCFWGVQFYFDQVPGVVETIVGYTGGHTKNPSYEEVCYSNTGHAEATLIAYDPNKVTYETLVKQFFYMHDSTQVNRQGPDIGSQYRSAIFYFDEGQRRAAEKLRDSAQKDHSQPIVTEITQASEFFRAEDYHQKFTAKTGQGMCHKPFKKM